MQVNHHDRVSGPHSLGERFPPDHFFPTMGSAVRAFVAEMGVDWIDWDDREEPEEREPPVP